LENEKMDEGIIKWIFYGIIFLVYYFIKNRAKKNQPQQNSIPDYQEPTSTTSTGKPVSFEDLLREIQQAKAPQAPEPKPEPKPYYEAPSYPKYEDYDDDIKEEVVEQEEVNYDSRKQDNIYDVYEKAKQAAFNRASLEETMKVEDTVVRYGQFKEYQQHEEPSFASLVAKDFEDPEKVKKAFIMSEILRRKY
jgi:hypothetical protein